MREHPLVPTIRRGLWCLLSIVLSAWSFEASFAAFTAGFGWWPGCGCCGGDCECDGCSGGGGPGSLQLDYAGFADGDCSPPCSYPECAALEGSYIFECESPITPNYCEGEECVYLHDGLTYCGAVHFEMRVDIFRDCNNLLGAGATHHWIVVAGIASSWREDVGTSAPDCNSFSARSIPWFANEACNFIGYCDNSGGSCTITAI